MCTTMASTASTAIVPRLRVAFDAVVGLEQGAAVLKVLALEGGEGHGADEREGNEADQLLQVERGVDGVGEHRAARGSSTAIPEGHPQAGERREQHADERRGRDDDEPRQVATEPEALQRRREAIQVDLHESLDTTYQRLYGTRQNDVVDGRHERRRLVEGPADLQSWEEGWNELEGSRSYRTCE